MHVGLEVELFVILAAFGPLYLTESSVLGAEKVLHVFRYFIIIIILLLLLSLLLLLLQLSLLLLSFLLLLLLLSYQDF